jgi:thiol-disulfide isomerase/thioredoxin
MLNNMVGRSRATALAGALLLALMAAPFAGAPVGAQSTGQAEAYWIENPSLTMTLTPFAAAAPGASATGTAAPGAKAGAAAGTAIIGEVFDSADYQRTLLLPAGWDYAYVLDLGETTATAYPRAALLDAGGAPRQPDPAAGTPAGAFVTDSDGRMSFADDRCEIVVGPTPPLIGAITRAELDQRQPTYGRRAASYKPDPAIVAQFAAVSKPLEILAFFGTWCSTCKHYLPGLIATLDRAANDKIRVTYIGVDENVTEPADLIALHHAYTTPVVILLSGGVELGRVEQEPRTTMEADLAAILKGEPAR